MDRCAECGTPVATPECPDQVTSDEVTCSWPADQAVPDCRLFLLDDVEEENSYPTPEEVE